MSADASMISRSLSTQQKRDVALQTTTMPVDTFQISKPVAKQQIIKEEVPLSMPLCT